LQEKKTNNIQAFLGFDACIDNIVRVIKKNGKSPDVDDFINFLKPIIHSR